MNRVVFVWGRYNPPTIGHQKLFDNAARVARFWGADLVIYPTHTQSQAKDPLRSDKKVEYLKKMFPQYENSFVYDTEVKTMFQALGKLQIKYDELVWVAGSDRVPEYGNILKSRNGMENKSGKIDFTFRKAECVSAGGRDPDAEGAAGMSASKMRDAAKKVETTKFMSGIPDTLSNSQKLELMQEVRIGMGLK